MRTINRRYVRPLAFTGTAIVALAVVATVIAVPNSTSGTAQSTAAFAATRALDTATGPFAGRPAVSYRGTVTAGDLRITLDGVAVSAAGDAAGTIGVADATADYRQAGSAVIARGAENFWRGVLGGDSTATVPDTSTWAHLDPTRVPDLGTLLAPSRLAGTLTGEQTGTGVGSDATPDARFRAATDPAIRRSTGTSFVAGDTTVTLDDTGKTVDALRGPIGVMGTGTSQVPVVADLRITPRDPAAAGAVYRDLTAQAGELAHAVAPSTTVSVTRSTARLAPGACTPPRCDVDVAIVASGASGSGLTVVATATVTFALRNRQVGRPCVRSVALGRTTTLRFRCAITALPAPTGPFAIRSTFSAAVFADTAPATISARLTDDQAMSTAAPTGTFRRAGVKTDAAAARYGTQITGLPSTLVYAVGGQDFDGRAADGVLLVTHGPGYQSRLDSDGAFESSWPGSQQMIAQARAQRRAAVSTPIRWVFAEKSVATAMATALAANGVTGIEVVTVAAAT